MKILKVSINRRRRCFEIGLAGGRSLAFPFAKCDPAPSSLDPVMSAVVDPELARMGFTFALKSGREGSVHVDHVLEYNQDPAYLRDLFVYRLTLEAQALVHASALSKREIIRRLGTSASQFYRLMDQTNYSKSTDQMLRLLNVLGCRIEPTFHRKSA
ncbi:MAG: helix-turn-helix domain-containing protein [Deltaproteobacteria bacterium]|nr:helix-turn-helix domain-containing protein [Deltaproteobacteria bacterium]